MDVFDLNLRHLRALASVCKCGSITGAAAAVCLSQPAITQGIAKIEAQTGTRMFERRPKGMVVTEGGALLASRVEAACSALSAGLQAIKKSGSGGFSRADRLITVTQMRALLALARAGSYVAAAGATGLSQPSIHRAVQDIERICGAKLTERRGRGVALTAAGTRLVRAFGLVVAELESGLQELEGLAGGDSGSIRVGAMPLARARLLPLAVAQFHRNHPNVNVDIVEGSHADLIERLRDGSLHLLVGALRRPEPGPDVSQEPLFEDRLIIVARAGHPLRGPDQPTFEQLARHPWIVGRRGSPLHNQWGAMFAKAGTSPPDAPVTCGSVMAIRTLLIESDFLTLLSPEQVRFDVAANVLTQIGPPLEETRREIGLTVRKDWYPTGVQTAFIEQIRSSLAQTQAPEIE